MAAYGDDPNEAGGDENVLININLPGGVIIPEFKVTVLDPIREVIERVVKTHLPQEEDAIYNLYVTTANGSLIKLERNYTVEDYYAKGERLLTCYSSIDLSKLPPPNLELNVQLREQGQAQGQ